ncbi:hypothetical protein OAP83_02365 [Rickettsiales bacterium]|nr:hypothetical protein [Rickettsiales bacterium]
MINNVVNFSALQKQAKTRETNRRSAFEGDDKKRICRIIYKDITINFWHKDNAYTCNVERGN